MSLTELKRAAGQLLVLGFEGTAGTPPLKKLLAELRPAGVILFARNLESAPQCHRLLRFCRAHAPRPLFTCVDLEGGTVDRFRQVLAPAPSAKDVFATGHPELFRAHGALLGAEARALGFNVDFAPCSDLAFPASANVLGNRAVSSDPRAAITYVREFLAGLASTGVLGCGKHFPGLGEGNLDSHHELPVIEKGWKRLWAEDLLPYRRLKAGFPFVMVAHAAYPSVTGDNLPASLSARWMTEVLRRRIGYKGLILSDDLEMGGVLAAGSIGHIAVETLRAGADMFLVCHQEAMVRAAWEAVVETASRDKSFAKLVLAKAGRVGAAKRRTIANRRPAPPPTAKTVAGLRDAIAAFQHRIEEAKR